MHTALCAVYSYRCGLKLPTFSACVQPQHGATGRCSMRLDRLSFSFKASEYSQAAAELRDHVLRLGGKPEEGGTTGGAMHRGWVAVRGTLTGYSDHAILDECESGEDKALGAYRKALKETLPSDIRALVQRQMAGVQKNHDQIKALRDQQPS